MRGGGLFVRGNVGNDVGLGSTWSGTIVIGGDAGENLGDPLSDVSVFIRGERSQVWQKESPRHPAAQEAGGPIGTAVNQRRDSR